LHALHEASFMRPHPPCASVSSSPRDNTTQKSPLPLHDIQNLRFHLHAILPSPSGQGVGGFGAAGGDGECAKWASMVSMRSRKPSRKSRARSTRRTKPYPGQAHPQKRAFRPGLMPPFPPHSPIPAPDTTKTQAATARRVRRIFVNYNNFDTIDYKFVDCFVTYL
jgi:hypothetical protein